MFETLCAPVAIVLVCTGVSPHSTTHFVRRWELVAFDLRFPSYRFVCQRCRYYWSSFPFLFSWCSFVAKLSSREGRSSNTSPCNCVESNWLWALIRLSRVVVDIGVAFRSQTYNTFTRTLPSSKPDWVRKCLSCFSYSLCRLTHRLGRCHPANPSR